MTAPLRWGILGTGGIAAAFATDLRLLPDAEVVAVGSRRAETADAFGDRLGVPHRHGSYADLVRNADVDVVYVATPQSAHHGTVLLALGAGKPVLCEKPFTLNAGEAAELVAVARQQGTFLMEAMWTRFLPHVRRLREVLTEGTLGDVRLVTADHGQALASVPGHRLLDPALGGGALLDLGVYPVSFASMVLGRPARVAALGSLTPRGVDAQTSLLLEHEGGRHAVLTTTLEARTPNRAAVVGTQARVELDGVFYSPTTFSVVAADGTVLERYDVPHEGHGLRHQAAEVARCLRAGLGESPTMPLDETVSILATLDEVRRQIGLAYPSER